VSKNTSTIMIYFFLGLAVLAALLLRIKYLCLDCYDTFFDLKYFLRRIYFTAEHLRSPNLDGVTKLKIHLAVERAYSMPRDHILFMFLWTVMELDTLKLLILACVQVYLLRGPRRHEFDAQFLSHRRAALRLMVYVVLLELLLLEALAELLIETVSLAWGVTIILWASVPVLLEQCPVGKQWMTWILAKLYRS